METFYTVVIFYAGEWRILHIDGMPFLTTNKERAKSELKRRHETTWSPENCVLMEMGACE